MKKYAALFGGSGNDRKSKEYLETVGIGAFLAKRGFIVKNGGYGGMMEAVSKGVQQSNGTAVGITCKQVGSEEGNTYLSQTIVTDKLFKRLEVLIEGTAIFIVQKGGIGTLSEVFLALDIIRKEPKGERPKLYFVGSIWRGLVDCLKTSLIPKYEHDLFQIVRNPEELEQLIWADFPTK